MMTVIDLVKVFADNDKNTTQGQNNLKSAVRQYVNERSVDGDSIKQIVYSAFDSLKQLDPKLYSDFLSTKQIPEDLFKERFLEEVEEVMAEPVGLEPSVVNYHNELVQKGNSSTIFFSRDVVLCMAATITAGSAALFAKALYGNKLASRM